MTFVKDTVQGFWEIANNNALNGEITNIGMNNEISVKDIAVKISALLKKDLFFENDAQRVRPVNSEVERLYCDNSKIIKQTNWRPKYNLDSGLTETIEWIKAYINIYKWGIYNV